MLYMCVGMRHYELMEPKRKVSNPIQGNRKSLGA